MKVHFSQSGGFVGALKECTLDTASMPAAAAKTLEDLVRRSALATSAESLSERGRDLEEYEIAIDDDGRNISVVFDSETIPQAAKQLVGYLKKCARPQR